jgi:hypothetical protein
MVLMGSYKSGVVGSGGPLRWRISWERSVLRVGGRHTPFAAVHLAAHTVVIIGRAQGSIAVVREILPTTLLAVPIFGPRHHLPATTLGGALGGPTTVTVAAAATALPLAAVTAVLAVRAAAAMVCAALVLRRV